MIGLHVQILFRMFLVLQILLNMNYICCYARVIGMFLILVDMFGIWIVTKGDAMCAIVGPYLK